jgi:hypothetical protein
MTGSDEGTHVSLPGSSRNFVPAASACEALAMTLWCERSEYERQTQPAPYSAIRSTSCASGWIGTPCG